MRRRQFGVGLLALPALARPAAAYENVLHIVRRDALSELPLLVMQQNRLIENQATKMNLGDWRVFWHTVPGTAEVLSQMLTNRADFGVVGAPELLDLWDHTVGTVSETRALSGVSLQPFMLVTRDQSVKTLADFSTQDTIAVPRVQASAQAVCLEMAAAERWGQTQYRRLDLLTVGMSSARAAGILISGHRQVDSHYAESPYYYDELATPGIHLVVKSNDTLGGQHVNGLLVAAPYFEPGNPLITQAVLAAQKVANDYIRQFPDKAAQIYLSLTRDRRRRDDVVGMITDPDVVWTTVPQRLMQFATFLHKVGRLRHMPASWKDLMLPEGQSGAGS